MPRWWVTDRYKREFAQTDADEGSDVGDVIDIELQLRRDLHLDYVFACFAFVLIFVFSCQPDMAQTIRLRRNAISTPLAAHDKELLAIPDVVGVYVGTLEDRRALCPKVMLTRQDPEAERKIPRMIEVTWLLQKLRVRFDPGHSLNLQEKPSAACCSL